MARLGLWLSGLHGLPEEALGAALPRLWGRGRAERLEAASSLEIAGQLLGFAGSLPAAALLAKQEGIDGIRPWVVALEPVAIGGQAGRAVLQPSGTLPETEAQALFAAATEHFAESPWQLSRGRERWYLSSTTPLDLQTPDPHAVWGHEPLINSIGGNDARPFHAFLNELQMLLAAHPVNGQRGAAALDPWCYFWPWGEGSLPASRPPCPWTHLAASQPELCAAAVWLGLEGWAPEENFWPEALLWVWAEDWRFPEAGQLMDRYPGVWGDHLRQGAVLELYTGLLVPSGGLERLRWTAAKRWAFWRGPARPGQTRHQGSW